MTLAKSRLAPDASRIRDPAIPHLFLPIARSALKRLRQMPARRLVTFWLPANIFDSFAAAELIALYKKRDVF
jgi:hypothetical protein